jgi:hypothetical protein
LRQVGLQGTGRNAGVTSTTFGDTDIPVGAFG